MKARAHFEEGDVFQRPEGIVFLFMGVAKSQEGNIHGFQTVIPSIRSKSPSLVAIFFLDQFQSIPLRTQL